MRLIKMDNQSSAVPVTDAVFRWAEKSQGLVGSTVTDKVSTVGILRWCKFEGMFLDHWAIQSIIVIWIIYSWSWKM